jgi:hypothetical protein
VFNKKTGKLITDASGRTGWANGYNPIYRSKPGNMILKGTLQFGDAEQAKNFADQLNLSKREGLKYSHNGKSGLRYFRSACRCGNI